jgi:alpha-tubulin suppressor-like RCC1 family protein
MEGGLWLWGGGVGQGQLGNNDPATFRSSPIQTISGGFNWFQISVGSRIGFVAAIKTDGTLWTWGHNANGQLGDNTVTAFASGRSSPVQTISGGTNWRQASAGGYNMAAIKTDGTLWLWGRNGDGQLGINDIAHRSSPVQIAGGGSNWKQVAMGGRPSGAAIKTDNTLWTWGRNDAGQLGVNDLVNRSSPVQILGGGTNWRSVASAEAHVAALKTDGTLWTWGWNNSAALGDNTTIHRSSPVQTVSGGNNWKSLASQPCSRSCGAIKTDGTLWLWGSNYDGSLGINNTVGHRSSPVQTIVGGFNWKEAIAGTSQKAGITFMD